MCSLVLRSEEPEPSIDAEQYAQMHILQCNYVLDQASQHLPALRTIRAAKVLSHTSSRKAVLTVDVFAKSAWGLCTARSKVREEQDQENKVQ